MRRSILVGSFLMLGLYYAQAQEFTDQQDQLKNVIPPSPNSASLGKYVEWPVDLNTGVPNIDIPLYTLKGRALSLPISVSYHASGIKVGETASWVGLGWSLQAGGVITRSVRGLPDDCGGAGYFAVRRMLPDYNNTFELANSSPTWKGMVKEQTTNQLDGVHDVYFFNALGRSYKFLFKDNGTSQLEVQTIPYSNVVIKTDFGGSGPNTDQWTVILEDGTQLLFGGTGYIEYTTNARAAACGATFASSWYLQSITSAAGEKITFTYINTPSIQMNSYVSMNDLVGWNSETGAYKGGTGTNQKMESQTLNLLQLDEITSETGSVKFNTRSDSFRLDLPGMRALSTMAVYSKMNGQVIPVDLYTFITHQKHSSGSNEYFVASADYMHWRLSLDVIKHNGIGSIANIPQWKFTYNPTALPSTLSYAQDHYGYYNGAISNISLLPRAYTTSPYPQTINTQGFFTPLHEVGNNRDLNGTYMQAGILTGITYPTGGSSQFAYEPNSYTSAQEQFASTSVNQSISLTYNQTPFTNSKTVSFTTTKGQYIYLDITTVVPQTPDFSAVSCKVEVTGPNMAVGKTIIINSINTNQSQYFDLPNAGTYNFTISTNANANTFSSASDILTIDANLRYDRSLGSSPTAILVGGLRVTSIIDAEGTDPSKNIERYFTYSLPTVLNPVDPSTDYVSQFSEVVASVQGGGPQINLKTARSSATKFSLGSGGSTIAYGKVLTRYGKATANGQSGKNGHVQTVFLNTLDVNNSGAQPNQAPYPDLDTREFERGLLLSETTFDSAGNKLRATYNTYSLIPKTQLSFFKSGLLVYYLDQGSCSDPLHYCGYVPVRETLTTEQVNKISAREVAYRKNGTTYDTLSTLTTFIYGTIANTQATQIVTTDSKGVTRTILKKTPFEKAALMTALTLQPAPTTITAEASTAIDAMITKNMVSNLLQEEQVVGGTTLNRMTTNYKISALNASLIAPDNVVVQHVGANSADTRIQFSYDGKGNLIEQQKTSDAKHSYVYDYKQSYPIAEVTGGDVAFIAYTSFEADGSGNWTISSSARDVNSFTGNKGYALGSNTLSFSGLSTKTYIVSLWATTGSTVNINEVAVSSSDSRNGWNYFQKSISATPSVSISGNGTVDEVRLYPAGSTMTTYTYGPYGMTSSTDANNTTTFYEYDGLGRLITIMDHKKKIVKTTEYNYKVAQ